ncbi:MAG: hypothetical protein KC492_23985 [Myxococcales bacterium]|nr:hypothetical protein [Myxococcales bacterium]
MRDHLAVLSAAFVLTACVSNLSDVPRVADAEPSSIPIFVLASGNRAYPGAARGYWQLAAEVAADLEGAGFDPVVILEPGAAPPDVPIIESVESPGECFSEPMLNVLSAGVIPHLGCIAYGHRFNLRCPNGRPSVAVDASFTVRSYVGWFVWPLAFSPNWRWDSDGPPSRRPEELSLLRQRLNEALTGACAA